MTYIVQFGKAWSLFLKKSEVRDGEPAVMELASRLTRHMKAGAGLIYWTERVPVSLEKKEKNYK